MEHLTETLMGMAGLGVLFALTAWLPLEGEAGGCGSCGGGCDACPGEGSEDCGIVDDFGGLASGAPSSGARPRKVTDGS